MSKKIDLLPEAQRARLLQRDLRETITKFAEVFNTLPDGSELKQMLNDITPGLIAYSHGLELFAELKESGLATAANQGGRKQ